MGSLKLPYSLLTVDHFNEATLRELTAWWTDPTVHTTRPSDRKLRLLLLAATRDVWDQLHDSRSRAAVEAAESCVDCADDIVPEAIVAAASQAVREANSRGSVRAALPSVIQEWRGARAAYAVVEPSPMDTEPPSPLWAEALNDLSAFLAPESELVRIDSHHRFLLREILGNPFRPVAILPDWRTSTAVGLAQSMYESRNFSPMPILADALEEAGCDNPDILSHCRGDGPHVRGCWVVDLVLGKA